jgi:hypothetical protein
VVLRSILAEATASSRGRLSVAAPRRRRRFRWHLAAGGVLCSDVPRILLIGSVIGVLALATGCSTASQAASWKQPSTAPSPAVASPPAATPGPVATVTAACPLLSTDELKALLGGANSQTKITAVESAPDVSRGFATYECKYGSGAKYPFDLAVTTTGQDFSPREGVAAIAKGSHVLIHDVTGLGQAGTFFTDSDGGSCIAVAKVSHGQTRTVIFSAPVVVPEQNFLKVATLVLSRV